ncbi:superoxide dismutase [Klebsiella variicola]|nr:superoxide dismutase [Klebsiella variicola]STW22468.1 superoxide dismutase [Klebsiella variicola]
MQRCILAILSLAFCAGAQAVSEDVQLNLVTPQGVGQSIGSVKITETDRGLEFAPNCGHCRRASTAFIFMPKAAASRR